MFASILQKIKNIISPKEVFSIQGKVRAVGRNKLTGEIVSDTGWNKNLIMLGTNTGKSLLLQRLGGVNTYTGNILYMDIGTGSTAPAVSDTQCTAAVARASSPVITITSNVVSFQFFLADANLANGTYPEVATFVDGSNTINTGQIFNHALFGTSYVKTAGVDTTVQIDFSMV